MLMKKGKYRLVVKGDFDGMACGILLRSLGLTGSTAFVHPKDVESGRFRLDGGDITAGLPYREGVHLAFDHFLGASHPAGGAGNLVADPGAASVSRVIFRHYGRDRFLGTHEDVVEAADKNVSAELSNEDILYPSGWVLLSCLADPRTGLEKYREQRLPHEEFMAMLIEEGGTRSVWEMLDLPDVEDRLNLYFSCVEEYKAQILRCSSVHSNVLLIDTRNEKVIFPGNKFAPYALFPECDVSLHVSLSADGSAAVLSAGRSVLDRGCRHDIGAVMRGYGGGGHAGAGACKVPPGEADGAKDGIVRALRYGLLENMCKGYFNYY